MVKPIRIILLLLVVHLILGALLFFFPDGKILLGKYSLRYFPQTALLEYEEQKTVDVNAIVERVQLSDSLLKKAGTRAAADSAQLESPLAAITTDSAERAQLALLPYAIEYPAGKDTLLFSFFRSLSREARRELIRVLHFGDSQIEGDRISYTLRQKMQDKFGGCGAGLVGVFEVSEIRVGFDMAHSPNWKKHAIYGYLWRNAGTNKYGVMGNFFKYNIEKDTTGKKLRTKAWVSYKPKFRNAYEQIALWYRNPDTTVTVQVMFDKQVAVEDSLKEKEGFSVKHWNMQQPPKEVRVEMEGYGSPQVYGISFDCKKGVAVDNVSMRGSSGTDFHRLDRAYLAEQIKAMNVRLIIYQYGVNAVPFLTKKSLPYYAKQYAAELRRLKQQHPDIPVLVVGVSDMSTTDFMGGHISYPLIDTLRTLQRKAAFDAGCAFWDLYEAMGGENAMVAWVTAKPALASPDYTHLNLRGARVVGEMIYNALLSEYYRYAAEEH